MNDPLNIGISGLALYVPPFRVNLKSWCDWTENPWSKISKVVGHSFRQAGRHESIYTMAANAVLRLIENYDIDPQAVGYLAFGTESSTDNSAGAVIIRGMVDRALKQRGQLPLSRDCEVPEFKHACLGGVYAMKSALRYLWADGRGRKAIIVAGDIAEYERGSTGEQTQGAGTVAMLLEENPQLCVVNLACSGSSSNYRGVDFRKPVARHAAAHYTPNVKRMHDFPVFNGKYSTYCYLDAISHATDVMFHRLGQNSIDAYRSAAAILFHRPYHWMPVQAMATLYIRGLAHSKANHPELQTLCDSVGVVFDDLIAEINTHQDLQTISESKGINVEPYPLTTQVAKAVRSAPGFAAIREQCMQLGTEKMMDVGNVYTAALPGWLAAAFEDAYESKRDLTDETVITVGYGSGDAAEAIPLRVVKNWQVAAAKIGFSASLKNSIELTQSQYERLHDGLDVEELHYEPNSEFVIDRIGQEVDAAFQDIGIEYYRYVPPIQSAHISARSA